MVAVKGQFPLRYVYQQALSAVLAVANLRLLNPFGGPRASRRSSVRPPDLTSWIHRPTVTRTGMKGYRTPSGTYRIIQRAEREWSSPYKVWMPYWQRFVRGVGLHDGWRGSHGCVNLLGSDAKSLHGKLRIGTTVKVFGRRPGT